MIRQLNSLTNMRKILRILLGISVVWLILPTSVLALGLGGIKLKSTLDQKLDASIELLNPTEQELTDISIKLASPAVYERMGIERTIQLEQLKFDVIQTDDGKHLIHVTTPLTVSEPFLNFLVEVNWATGRLLREFTVLLDPPVFLDGEGASSLNAPEADLPPVLTTPAGTTEVETPFASIIEEKPQASDVKNGEAMDDEISKILTGEDGSDTKASSTIDDKSKSVKSADSLVYEKVKTNEILWRIAEKMRPQDISVEQMMLALQRENPSAFYGDNVSFLKAGAILRIEDTSTLSSISSEQAVLEIDRQHKEWLSYRKERQAKNAVAAESANLTPLGSETSQAATGAVAVTNVSDEPLLKLVAPVSEKSEVASESSNAALEAAEEKVNELNIELVMANEELEARKRENEDLVVRLNSLEEQMSAMQSLVQLKDAELAKLRTGESVTQDADSVLTPLKVEMPGEEESNVTVTKVISKDKAEQEPKLWQDPVTMATAIFAILLIVVGGALIKRKSKNKQFVKEKQEAVSEKSLDELFPVDKTNPKRDFSKTEKEFINFNTTFDTDDGMIDDLAPMTDISFENTLFAESDEDLLDPMSEADVYLTYEKFDKAEKLLKDAIQSSPDRHELKLKLLEVYAASDNKDAFNSQVDEFYAAINGDETHPLWPQAINFAKIIQSDNPLFGSSVVAPFKSEVNRTDDSMLATGMVNPLTSEQDNVVIATPEKQVSVEDSVADREWRPDQVTEFTALNDENTDVLDTSINDVESAAGDVFNPSILDEIDTAPVRERILDDTVTLDESVSLLDNERFEEKQGEKATDFDGQILEPFVEIETAMTDIESNEIQAKSSGVEEKVLDVLISDEDKASKSDISDADLAKAMSSFTETAIAEDLDIEDKQESEITVSDVFNDLPLAGSTKPEKQESFGDTSFFLLSDEVGTKLDLARAYIEMGDHEGALDLLNEVLVEGNQKQKLEARELMEMTTA